MTVVIQRVTPADAVQDVVDPCPGVRGHGVAQRAPEQGEIVVVHQRLLARSSRRRAMMLRWISELPP